ncbi:MAG: ABC transporter substrate-binding protein [Acidimicrobiales bacterium]
MRTRTAPITSALVALAVSGALLLACAANGPAGAAAEGSTKRVTSSAIAPGTVLRVGEQLKNLSTILSLAGQDKDFPYQVQYSEFVGGPTMLQAFQGGAIDIGYVFSTPLIFAQAAGQAITAVAAFGTRGSGYALVSAPGNTSIKSWADLKGKKVAYQVGTASEAVLLEGLKSAGLSYKDITTVNLPTTQIAVALQGGSADAGITVEPLLSVYLHANPTAHVIAYSTKVTDRTGFLIATSAALANPAKSAALANYITRLVKSYNYLRAHPAVETEAILVQQYGLSPARAAEVAAREGPTTFFELPGAVQAAQQNLANLFAAAGQIPSRINVAKEFDPRFNDLVTSVQGS